LGFKRQQVMLTFGPTSGITSQIALRSIKSTSCERRVSRLADIGEYEKVMTNIFFADQCSHMRAVDYYAESVFKKRTPDFHAILCNSWDEFTNHNCFGTQLTPGLNNMGLNANPKLSGNFYLRTNGFPKFSRDSNGIFFTDHIFASYLN
jgi:hypothetical protein